MFKVVIIDDEEWVRFLIKELIPWESIGLKIVGEASNGFEGLEVCYKSCPDIVLTDIRMPGMDGLELLGEFEKNFPNTKVIVISGFDDFSYVKRAIETGAIDYILKPIEEDDLIKVLEKIKERIRKERAQKEQIKKLKSQVMKLQSEVVGTNGSSYEVDRLSGNDIINKSLLLIEEEYNTDLTLERMAEKVFMSPGYFSELFKREVGKGFTEYLTELRIEKAKALLSIPGIKIVELAGMVGYRDSNYFAKVFKKYTGYTPGEYREKKF